MRRILLTAGLLAVASAAYSIPAKPGIIKYTQPDGTVVDIKMIGDEYGHITLSADGLVVADNDGRLEYARLGLDGSPVPSGIVLGEKMLTKSERANLQTQQQIDNWMAEMNALRIDNIRKRTIKHGGGVAPVDPYGDDDTDDDDDNEDGDSAGDGNWAVPKNFTLCESSFKSITGSPKCLVILVEYQDFAFEYGDYDYFQRMLNEEGFSDYGALGSVSDYFVENSLGQFTPEFDVYGPVLLPNVRAYYGGNGANGDDDNPHFMAIHAMRILDDEVDFSQYDNDGDGVIDNVFIIYAGQGEHDSTVRDAVWPHSWDVTSASPFRKYYFDDVLLDHYACTCEHPTGYDRPDGIGTFVHEFSHVMGLPDLYVTTYSGGFTPGAYQALDSGPYNNDGLTPPNYSSYERCTLGWIEMKPMEEGLIELPELIESNVAYVVPTENKGEYFFFENRQQRGNDQFIPGHGMLVWHIDYDKTVWDRNAVNNTANHQRVDLIEADNNKSDHTRDADLFPGPKEVTEFMPDSTPAFVSWKKKNLIFGISDIQESEDGIISFMANAQETEKPPYSDPESGVASPAAIGKPSSDIYFDLTGRRISNPSKGLYIVDGKKVIVK